MDRETADRIAQKLQALHGDLKAHHNELRDRTGKVLEQPSMNRLAVDLDLKKWISEGGIMEHLSEWLPKYLAAIQQLHHPHYIGHQVAASMEAGAAAQWIDGAINNPMGIYEMGPSAATVEMAMVQWMIEKTGWHQYSEGVIPWQSGRPAGVLTHGGSLANLTCLLAARAAKAPGIWTEGHKHDLTIMAPRSAHYCVERSAGIMGIGTNNVAWIPTDDYDRIYVDKLEATYQQALAAGQSVFALTANACITSTGLYDDLETIGRFCSENNIWFHVDGAHGASALLTTKYSHYLDGLEYADSMIWDAHKMLRSPALCAAVLFKDYDHMQSTFQQEGSYIFHDKDQPGIDTLAYTLECTKAALGTKLFLTIAQDGEQAMADFVESRYDMALKAYHFIQNQEDFHCLVQPESNILCFNYKNHDALMIRKKLIAEGSFYITTATVNGTTWLRLTIMNAHTDLKDIEKLLLKIKSI